MLNTAKRLSGMRAFTLVWLGQLNPLYAGPTFFHKPTGPVATNGAFVLRMGSQGNAPCAQIVEPILQQQPGGFASIPPSPIGAAANYDAQFEIAMAI